MSKSWKSDQPCIVTGQEAEWHHIAHRSTHPELEDAEFNLIPVCREIHTLWHSKGNSYMCQHFPQIKKWMKSNGWSLCPVLHKWVSGRTEK